jgi:hypothetical protein
MRTLVIGDIHGGLRALHQIMERAKVTPKDSLIFFRRLCRWLEPIPTGYRFLNRIEHHEQLHFYSWES